MKTTCNRIEIRQNLTQNGLDGAHFKILKYKWKYSIVVYVEDSDKIFKRAIPDKTKTTLKTLPSLF